MYCLALTLPSKGISSCCDTKLSTLSVSHSPLPIPRLVCALHKNVLFLPNCLINQSGDAIGVLHI